MEITSTVLLRKFGVLERLCSHFASSKKGYLEKKELGTKVSHLTINAKMANMVNLFSQFALYQQIKIITRNFSSIFLAKS